MCQANGKYLMAILIGLALGCCLAEARQITDMAGRQVTIPDEIHKVYATSPPATYMVYAMDPSLVAGLNFPFNASEKTYLDPRMAKLPVIGGWFGQGRIANLETLLQVQPEIILVWMWQDSAVNKRIEQALRPLKIPVVCFTMKSLSDYPAVFRFMGSLFNRPERAGLLARYTEETLAEATRATAAISSTERLTVYYAEGADGLSTECHASVHAQLIPLSGGINVHRCGDHSSFGMQKITMEQVLQYDPQVIVFHEPSFADRLLHDPKWRNIRAVRDGRVYQIPRTPFNWFDRPPSFMRLLGLKWMIHRLYPQAFPLDPISETCRFYRLFLNVTLDEASARELVGP